MDNKKFDQNRLREIIKVRLLEVPEEIRKFLPPVLLSPWVTFFTYSTDTYIMLAFTDATERKRIDELKKKDYHPFPGLVKPDNISSPVAMNLQNARNFLIQGNTVKNLFSFSLGKDCTLILRDHTQHIESKELGGAYEYTINLAYIISFGDEITSDTLYDYFEDLIAYSFKQWKG